MTTTPKQGSKERTDALVLAALETEPDGTGSAPISTRIGRSADATKRSLMRLRKLDRVRYVGRGSLLRWYLPRHEKTALLWYAQALQQSRAKRHERNSRHYRAKRAREIARALEDRMPTQRIVAAEHAQPLPKSGPASVWELG